MIQRDNTRIRIVEPHWLLNFTCRVLGKSSGKRSEVRVRPWAGADRIVFALGSIHGKRLLFERSSANAACWRAFLPYRDNPARRKSSRDSPRSGHHSCSTKNEPLAVMTVDEGYEWDWTETAREVLVPWRPFGLGDADQPLLPPEDFSRVLVIQHPGAQIEHDCPS